jgi:hypothetical protein
LTSPLSNKPCSWLEGNRHWLLGSRFSFDLGLCIACNKLIYDALGKPAEALFLQPVSDAPDQKISGQALGRREPIKPSPVASQVAQASTRKQFQL